MRAGKRGTAPRSYLTHRLIPAFGHLCVSELQAVHIGVRIKELEF